MNPFRTDKYASQVTKGIAEILAEFDIMMLREGNPDIVDEYRPEAEDISRRLLRKMKRQNSVSPTEIGVVLASVFEFWFEEKFAPEDFEAPARGIHSLLKTD